MTKRDTDSRDSLMVAALARGATQVEAAKAAGVTARTVRRRMEDPGFVARVKAATDELVRHVDDRLTGLACRAVDTLEELITSTDTPPAVKLRAATGILSAQRTWRQSTEHEERMQYLEELVAESDESIS